MHNRRHFLDYEHETRARVQRWLLSVGVALAAMVSAADSITIDGTTHDGVYIRESEAFYYVQLPAAGKVISVRKAAVPPEDVHISKDRAELLEQWKAKRRKTGPGRGAKAGASAWERRHERLRNVLDAPRNLRDSTQGEPQTKPNPLPAVGNRSNESKRLKPVFISKTGTVIFTNRPERYRDQREYVEVRLRFEQIAVPERYRPSRGKTSTAATYTAAIVEDLAKHYARQYALDPNLVLAVISQESNFALHARSPAGACGLMQLMPATAAEMGVTDIFDPAENIAAGTQYLAKMLRLFNDDTALALAGYNVGPATVKKHRGIPPFPETQHYVQRVKQLYQDYAAGKGPVGYVTGAPRPMLDRSHEGKAPYLVQFKNGWTQPAEEVAESDDFYFVTFANRTTQIRKSYVRLIKGPAQG